MHWVLFKYPCRAAPVVYCLGVYVWLFSLVLCPCFSSLSFVMAFSVRPISRIMSVSLPVVSLMYTPSLSFMYVRVRVNCQYSVLSHHPCHCPSFDVLFYLVDFRWFHDCDLVFWYGCDGFLNLPVGFSYCHVSFQVVGRHPDCH